MIPLKLGDRRALYREMPEDHPYHRIYGQEHYDEASGDSTHGPISIGPSLIYRSSDAQFLGYLVGYFDSTGYLVHNDEGEPMSLEACKEAITLALRRHSGSLNHPHSLHDVNQGNLAIRGRLDAGSGWAASWDLSDRPPYIQYTQFEKATDYVPGVATKADLRERLLAFLKEHPIAK